MQYLKSQINVTGAPLGGASNRAAVLILPEDINALQGKLKRAKRRQRNERDRKRRFAY